MSDRKSIDDDMLKDLLAIIAISLAQRSSAIDGVIYSKINQTFLPIFSIKNFGNAQDEFLRKLEETDKNEQNREDLRFIYFEV